VEISRNEILRMILPDKAIIHERRRQSSGTLKKQCKMKTQMALVETRTTKTATDEDALTLSIT